jgi:tetratricopeptide (TPR) repeat protein
MNRSKRGRWVIFAGTALALVAGVGRADEQRDDAQARSQRAPSAPAALKNEMAGYARLAMRAADESKWQLAEHFVDLIVNLAIPDGEKKATLLELAERYEKENLYAKAIAFYEKMAEVYAKDPNGPELHFKLGLLYRKIGAPQRAITRFYSVLNSALRVDVQGAEAHRTLTQRAQLEIAETHFVSGDYAQASKFLELLIRLDLPADDKAQVLFKSAHCNFLLGKLPAAVDMAQKFLADFPEHASVPEARYLLATIYRSLHKPQQAFEAVIALLKEENARKLKAPEQWVYWQKKTGNEFANAYYEAGDYVSALTIYQTLARLNEDADWQWPVIYQMGLCFERLRLASRAAEAYRFILDAATKLEADNRKPSESAANIVQMARWRGEHLVWSQSAQDKIQHLLGDPLAPLPAGFGGADRPSAATP